MVQASPQRWCHFGCAFVAVCGDPHKICDNFRRSIRSADAILKTTHDLLAFVHATDGIDTRRVEAVRSRSNVIGDEDLRIFCVPFEQCTKGPEHLSTFDKALTKAIDSC